MITHPDQRSIISSLGWVDRGALWLFDVVAGREVRTELSQARYLSVRPGSEGYFAVVHHFESSQLKITAHHFNDPFATLGEYQIDGAISGRVGSLEPWRYLPKHFVAHVEQPTWSDFALATLGDGGVSLQTFDWYDNGYDKMYQGIVGVVEIPSSDNVVISVQRSSRLVIYDPNSRELVRTIDLSGGSGNPRLHFDSSGDVLWADDYDTILKLEAGSWNVIAQRRLQDSAQGTAQFIGEYTLNADETLCVVPRPFSGDVLVVGVNDLATRYHAEIGMQPLQAVLLADGRVIGRDWQTGTLLQGEMW